MNLDISLDTNAVKAMIANSGATGKQAEKATISALRKLRRNVQTLVKREVGKELRVPQKALDGRVYGSTVDNDAVLTIWIGTRNLLPHQLGKPVPSDRGVRVGRYRTFPGAFIANVFGNGEAVWIRARSKHYTPALYPSSDWRVRVPGKYGHRFPVIKVGISIADEVERVIERNRQSIIDLFMRRLDQELNYYVNVRGSA